MLWVGGGSLGAATARAALEQVPVVEQPVGARCATPIRNLYLCGSGANPAAAAWGLRGTTRPGRYSRSIVVAK